MILSSEIKIKLKKEHFPNLIYEFCKRSCDINSLDLVETENGEDVYVIETIYSSRQSYIGLIDILKKNRDKYNILSRKNSIEEKIKGGLLEVRSRNPIESTNDYNMNILGAAELIAEKISAGEGADYSSITRNAAVISGINSADDPGSEKIFRLYSETEKEALTLGRFSGMNAIPLIIKYSGIDDLIRTINRIEKSFSVIRLIDSGTEDHLIADQIADNTSIPFLSRDFDELPLYLLSAAIMIVKKYDLNPADTSPGFIGINSASLRCSSLFNKTGFFRVLGNDASEKMMMDFENYGGLATSADNILLNTDIVFFLKNSPDDIDLSKIRPGQFIVIFNSGSGGVNLKAIKERGAREIIQIDRNSTAHIHPGIIQGMLKSEKKRLSDQALIHTSKKLARMMNVNFSLPDLFTDIHKKIESIICETS